VWANLVNEKLGTSISTQQTQGPNQNIILIDERKIDLGMTTMGVALQAWNGTGAWTNGKKFQNIRATFPMYDTPFHFVTLENSGIRSVKDLAGKKSGIGPRAGTCGTYFPMMFKALGVDTTIRNGQASDMAANLQDGLIDAFPFCAGVPITAYSELDATNKARFLTNTEEEIKKLQQAMPELSKSTIPKGTYRQQAEDHRTVGVYNFGVAHKDLPESLVYGIMKAVLENNAQMVKGHAAAKETLVEPQHVPAIPSGRGALLQAEGHQRPGEPGWQVGRRRNQDRTERLPGAFFVNLIGIAIGAPPYARQRLCAKGAAPA
jgi:TRAP transporter TAXI family solute receptor